MTKLTLYEATTRLHDHIEMWSENRFWVTAEIKSLSRNPNGHAYLELIQKAPDSDNTIAEARATIWRNVATKVFSKFLFATDRQLAAGMQVLLAASFVYSQKYGISLNITDIDPTYTLGDMQQRRLQIIKRLTEGGLINLNKSRNYPTPVRNIAVISSATAAGYTDFLNTLNNNPYHFAYSVKLFPAIMQGENSEQSILNALSAIDSEIFDIIVIIRGGGASTDLLAFDSEPLAVACAHSPLPIITGIGHQRDTSILDMVAYHNAITPTATAEYILSRTLEIANHLAELNLQLRQSSTLFLQHSKSHIEQYAQNLAIASSHFVQMQRTRLNSTSTNLNSATAHFLQLQRTRLNTTLLNLNSAATHFVQMQNTRLTNYASQLKLLHPDNILRRGYTITTMNGKAITSPEQAPTGSLIETHTANGLIKSQTI